MLLTATQEARAYFQRQGRRACSTQSSPEPMLVRDFIHRALYAPDRGYFVQKSVIGRQPAPMDFPNLLGQWEYMSKLRELYDADENSEAWFTPVEIFQPWYSYGLADYMLTHYNHLRRRRRGLKLRIFEIGAGSGTNALHILDYIRLHRPHVYRAMEYTTLEISPTLAEVQRERLAPAHSRVHRGLCVDATTLGLGDGAAIQPADIDSIFTEEPCFVLAMEVLDNLPHDKGAPPVAQKTTSCFDCVLHPPFFPFVSRLLNAVQLVRDSTSGGAQKVPSPSAHPDAWNELWVRRTPRGWEEEARPLQDPWIKEAIESMVYRPQTRDVQETGDYNDNNSGAKGPSEPPGHIRGWFPRFDWRVRQWMGRLQSTLQGVLYHPEERRDADSDTWLVQPIPSNDTTLLPASGDVPATIPPLKVQQAPDVASGLGTSHAPLGHVRLAPERLWRSLGDDPDATLFVPTGAMRLLHALQTSLPAHRLIAADFNALPKPKPAGGAVAPAFRVQECGRGGNRPLVARRDAHARDTADYASYLAPDPAGAADIFFATDFAALAQAVAERSRRNVSVQSTGSFLRRHVGLENLRTMSGFNPVLHTYSNTRVLTSF